jgi:hypothetical protein
MVNEKTLEARMTNLIGNDEGARRERRFGTVRQ